MFFPFIFCEVSIMTEYAFHVRLAINPRRVLSVVHASEQSIKNKPMGACRGRICPQINPPGHTECDSSFAQCWCGDCLGKRICEATQCRTIAVNMNIVWWSLNLRMYMYFVKPDDTMPIVLSQSSRLRSGRGFSHTSPVLPSSCGMLCIYGTHNLISTCAIVFHSLSRTTNSETRKTNL